MILKAVFLDIDGVVVLSEPLHEEKIIGVAADPLQTGRFDPVHGVKIDLATDWVNELAGIGDHRVYEWIKNKNNNFPLAGDDFITTCLDYYLKNTDRLDTRPSLVRTVQHFSQQGLYIAAVSSGVREQVDANLTHAGIGDYLLFADSADDVEPGKTKPHPAPYANALVKMNRLQKTSIQPEECLVIEDTSSGIQSGHGAGMKTVHWTLNDETKHNPAATYKLGPADSLHVLAQRLVRPRPGRRNKLPTPSQ